jgi:hypothetical protein
MNAAKDATAIPKTKRRRWASLGKERAVKKTEQAKHKYAAERSDHPGLKDQTEDKHAQKTRRTGHGPKIEKLRSWIGFKNKRARPKERATA